MDYENNIKKYLKQSGGIITTSYCKENNIPTVYLTRMVKKGLLVKVEKGIYITQNGDYDELYFYQYRFKKAIFSYETALFLLGLIDKIPRNIDVTVYNGYKFNEKSNNFNIHYTNKSIYDLGIIEKSTMFGNKIKLYSYERILCDFISHKDKMDTEVYVKLVQSYFSYKDKNIHSLYEIANKMGIQKKVIEVMEIVCE
ncbi:type IV toxin-antitoxin system AbiEi family antitoxin domain-containing protein [Mycoplasma sp. CSL7503-lung]|uniref:type IV toxin-antitoxin system AbiEi family antitoxin domain-containing protein n=1 Tax=Mycoplasma sp. CSL7503-lung TaxID=536372 RepID=UPI0021D22538|nr:type IV toxin-antitoxin system AbiEi family antitoxin domain-containing protein [Mycoplasma sp. CSL7503-lung]MCU4706799.1 type IV toxin-antitoxin system AbiEi family antitoxin domain-containing protein [Mycoplasma sp. CSL7503-lung]